MVTHTQAVSHFTLTIILYWAAPTSWSVAVATVCIFATNFLVNKLIGLFIYIKIHIVTYWISFLPNDSREAQFECFLITKCFKLGFCHRFVFINPVREFNQCLS